MTIPLTIYMLIMVEGNTKTYTWILLNNTCMYIIKVCDFSAIISYQSVLLNIKYYKAASCASFSFLSFTAL